MSPVAPFQERLTECVAGAVPEPESAMVVGELVALLTTVAVPLSAPDVAGSKMALKVVDCPAARVSGMERPLWLKPVPATVSCESEMEELPLLVSVTVCDLLVCTVTLPKLMDAGFAVSCVDCVTPVPESMTLSEGVGALLTSANVPAVVEAV